MLKLVWTAAAVAAAVASPLASQELRGVARDSATRLPIPGVVLLLLDSARNTLGRNITNNRGEYRVALTAAIRRVRAVRIGFRPAEVAIPATSGTRQLDLVLAAIPALLEPVQVTDASHCPRRSDRAAALALWEQVKSGLLATVVAREASPAQMRRLGFDRTMDGSGDRIAHQSVRIDSGRSTQPYAAVLNAAGFVRHGFAEDSAGIQIYYGPDAEVLLDDAFAMAYCFRLMDRDRQRPHQIGLGFSPARTEPGHIDIDGAIWIDSIGPALVGVEFRYLGLGREQDRYRPGGRVSFHTMDNGSVVIDRWTIRMVTSQDTVGAAEVRPTHASLFVREVGGELAQSTWPDGYTWRASLGTLRGRVTTKGFTPADSTVVRLADTDYRATIDATGAFEITDLLPGPYNVAVIEPQLDEIGIDLDPGVRFTAVRDSVSTTAFERPTVNDFIKHLCGDVPRLDNGLVIGRLTTPTGSPAAGASFDVSLVDEGVGIRLVRGTTGSDGLFHKCFVPRAGIVLVKAARDDLSPTTVRTRPAGPLTVIPVRMTPR